MRALHPVPQLLVGEAVARTRRDEQPLGEDRRGPARAPGEDLLEHRPVQFFPVSRSQTAPCSLVDPSGNLRGQPAHRRAPEGRAGHRGDADRDAQAHQVQMGAEDVLRVRLPGHVRGERFAYLGEQPQGERVPVVAGGEGIGREGVPPPGLFGLARGEIAQAHGGRKSAGRTGGAVQRVGRAERTGGLPVLGPAGDHEAHLVVPQPSDRSGGPPVQPVGEEGRHLLGAVQQDEQRGSRIRGEPCHPLGSGRRHVAPGPGCGDDPTGLAERTGDRVGHRGVVGQQVRATQPDGEGGVGAAGAAGGERREFGGAAGTRHSHEAEDDLGTFPGGRERRELRRGVRAFDGVGPGAGTSCRTDRHRGELKGARKVEVTPVPGDACRVAPQQRAQRPFGFPARERHRQAGGSVCGAQGGAEHRDDSAGLRIEHGPADRRAAQGVAAVRAERQLQGGADPVGTAGHAVRHGHRAQHPRLPPPMGGDAYVRTRLDPVPLDDRQRLHAEHVEPPGAHEREVQLRERGDRLGPDRAAPATCAVQDKPGKSVDRFMTGHDRAAVVRDEPCPPQSAGRIADTYQRRPVPASHGPTLGRR